MSKKEDSLDSKSSHHSKVNKLSLPYKKIKYCTLVSEIIKKSNKLKIKNSHIFSVVEFLHLTEKLNIRIICKQWNEMVKLSLSHIFSKENYLNCIINNNISSSNTKILLELKKSKRRTDLTDSDKKCELTNLVNKEKIDDYNFSEFRFENSNKKFSKKKVLVKLINSKNFNTIKNKLILGEMTKSRNIF